MYLASESALENIPRTKMLFDFYAHKYGFDNPFFADVCQTADQLKEKGKYVFHSLLELACCGFVEIHTEHMVYPDDDVKFSLKRIAMTDEKKVEALEKLASTASEFSFAYKKILNRKLYN